MWLPSFVYSEEKELHYALAKKLDFKAQTRLWGYNLGHAAQEQELSKILVETPVTDETKTANDLSPVQAQRSWDRQAEDNVTDRLQRLGLIAPKGEVDKVLETVVNNLEVTNNLDIEPEVRCRVMMTTTLESYTLGHTIVLSRGLIDVLPDEASLATIIAHELGHVVLGHRMDSHYAFFDQLLVDDKDTFRHFGFARTPDEENAAERQSHANCWRSRRTRTSWPTPNFSCTRWSAAEGNSQPDQRAPGKSRADVGESESRSAGSTRRRTKPPQIIAALPIGGRVKIDRGTTSWNC